MHGLIVLGVDLFAHRIEQTGLAPPDWRVYRLPAGQWIGEETTQAWSEIRSSDADFNHDLLVHMAGQISHHLRECGWRLRQVSNAYHEQLVSWTRSKRFGDGRRSFDAFTWAIFLAVESYLIEACRLRDRLNTFFVWAVLGHADMPSSKSLQKLPAGAAANGEGLAQALLLARQDGCWLKQPAPITT